jgi:hypothetical protein
MKAKLIKRIIYIARNRSFIKMDIIEKKRKLNPAVEKNIESEETKIDQRVSLPVKISKPRSSSLSKIMKETNLNTS